MKNILLILALTVGGGIFSLPFALKDAGLILFILFLCLLSFSMAKINYFYRQVVDAIPGRHQLPGYVEKVLGKREKLAAILLLIFSSYGAMLAYIILGGSFVASFSGITQSFGSLFFWAAASLLLFFTGAWLEVLDVFLSFLKIILFVIIILFSFIFLQLPFNLPLVGDNPPAAYGQILFALAGFSIIPELKKDKHINISIYTAALVISLLYLGFAMFLYPFAGGDGFIFQQSALKLLFNLTGTLAVFTPYLMLSWVGYDLFSKDLGFGKKSALGLTTTIPFFLFLLGVQDFGKVISFTGAIFMAGVVVLIIRMYKKKFPEKNHTLSLFVETLFILGMFLELYHLLVG